MKVLWLTNTIFPAPSKALSIPTPVFGGWMFGIARRLSESKGIKLTVATTYLGKEFKSFEIESVVYYLLPSKTTTSLQKKLESFWDKVCDDFKPDLTNINVLATPCKHLSIALVKYMSWLFWLRLELECLSDFQFCWPN